MNESAQAAKQEEQVFRRRSFGTVTVLTLLALFLACLLLSVVNDMYAFVKPDRAVTLEVKEPTLLGDLAELLSEHGVVINPTVFSLYVKSKGRAEELESFYGDLSLNATMSYREILLEFQKT